MRMPVFTALVAVLVVSACTGRSATPTALPTAIPTSVAPTTTPTPAPTLTSPAPTVSPTPDELSPKPGLESAPPTGLPTCKGSALTVTDADTLVSPSYREEVYALRTTGPDCQLKGFPTVSFRDASGRAMTIRTQHGGFGLPPEQPTIQTISRSTSLSFVIASSRDGACTDVAKVIVTLPMTTGAHTVSTALRVCGTTVGLSPVERRTDIH